MINHKGIIQGTEEWFDIKWGKIGGTLAKGLFVDSDTLFIDILSQKLEEFEYEENTFSSAAMERGNDLEPFAREFLNKYTGLEFLETGWLQSEENELLGISPDGITEDETIQCEIKCFGRKKHTEVLLKNEIPKEYIYQCIHAFTVNPKLEQLYFIAFRPESLVNNFIKMLGRSSIVNVGTEKKPKPVPIKNLVDISKNKAKDLLDRINNELKQINF